MNLLLLAAGVLAFITGILHSVLGERFIVGRLMIVEIGRTSERRGFVRHVIRFAWHLTTVFLFGFAALLLNMAAGLHADRKSTRLNSSHQIISYAVFCLKKKKRVLAHNDFRLRL